MDNSYDDEHWSSRSSSSDSQSGDHDIDGSRSSDSYDDGWRNWALTYIIGYYSGSIREARATTTAASLTGAVNRNKKVFTTTMTTTSGIDRKRRLRFLVLILLPTKEQEQQRNITTTTTSRIIHPVVHIFNVLP